jgi:predicted MFS family arabinose efflux permease
LLLALTVSLQMASALALWLVFALGRESVAMMVPLMALGALAAGLTSPAWSSLIPALVPSDDFPGALRLNSMQYAVGRAIGPILGAVTLKALGPTACFAVNALTFPLVIGAVLLTPERHARAASALSIRSATDEVIAGWRYLATSPRLLYPPLATIVIAGFGFGLTTLAPAFADRKLGGSSDDNGLLIAAFGLGGVIGVLSTAWLGRRVRPGLQIGASFAVWVVTTALLASTSVFAVGVVAMAGMGLAHGIGGITLTTVMQSATNDTFRGRVMAVYTQMFFFGAAVGSFLLGAIAERVSLMVAAATSSLAFAVWLVVSLVRFDGLRVIDPPRRTTPDHLADSGPISEPDSEPLIELAPT